MFSWLLLLSGRASISPMMPAPEVNQLKIQPKNIYLDTTNAMDQIPPPSILSRNEKVRLSPQLWKSEAYDYDIRWWSNSNRPITGYPDRYAVQLDAWWQPATWATGSLPISTSTTAGSVGRNLKEYKYDIFPDLRFHIVLYYRALCYSYFRIITTHNKFI